MESARTLPALTSLPDARLERRLRSLAWGEKQVLAAFLRHLSEFDRRKLYAPRGYSSLFQYCTKDLRLSEDEAYLRIQAARMSREHPEILGMLARGEAHLSGLAKLAPCLNAANAGRLLAESRGKTKREIERMVAGFGDAAPQRDVVKFLPSPKPPVATAPQKDLLALPPAQSSPSSPPSVAPEPPAREAETAGSAAAPSRLVRIAFTASEELLGKIERARALTRHKHPAGRLEDLVGSALDALLARRDPAKRRPTKRPPPEPARPRPRSRRIPRWVRDEVWRRDGGRCAFVSRDGKRCDATEWLEFDHVVPYALGGASENPAGIRLLCRAHNQHAAEQVFGPRATGRGSRRGSGLATELQGTPRSADRETLGA